MTRKDEELLFRDLSSRLPYGVKLLVPSWDEQEMEYIDKVDTLYSINGDKYIKTANEDYDFSLEDVKPYLFPLSSMTEEQEKELSKLGVSYGEYALHDDTRGLGIMVEDAHIFFKFCYKHHIDFLGLIKMGSAIDATGKNIY